MNENFEIIVHRGHNLRRGENSLAGIEEIRALCPDFMIEIDVCITQDDIPILYHDLTFDRLCGDPRPVEGTAFHALPERRDGEPIARLDEILEAFPDQRFLLDIRTHVHADFLRESHIPLESLTPALTRAVPAVERLLGPHDRERIRFVVGNPEHREYLLKAFPGFDVDVAEHYSRDYLDRLPGLDDASILGENLRRMYVRFREVTPQLISWAHGVNLKIIANHAPSRRSLETSKMMLEKSLQWGMDGLTASPLDEDFLKIWRSSQGVA